MPPVSELSAVAIAIMQQRGFVLIEREARNWNGGKQEMDEAPHLGLFNPEFSTPGIHSGYVQSTPRHGLAAGVRTQMDTPSLDRMSLVDRVAALEQLFASAVPFQRDWTNQEGPIPIYVEDAYVPWKTAVEELVRKYPGNGRSSELRADRS